MDKIPYKSKKFLAYIIADLGWKAVLFYLLYINREEFKNSSVVVMMAIIITAGFVQVGYILGQAALDKYIVNATKILGQKRDEEK